MKSTARAGLGSGFPWLRPTSSSWRTGCRSTGSRTPDGTPGWRGSPGGLVTAVEPIMRANERHLGRLAGRHRAGLEPFEDDGMTLDPISLTERRGRGASTRGSPTPPCGRSTTTWSPSRSSTASGGTPTSRSTNASPSTPPSAPPRTRPSGCTTTSSSWCRSCCASSGPDLRIGFYLHIPFPPAELFQQLPWRRQLLEGLLGADLVGFQLPGGAAELRPAGPAAGRPQDPPRPRLPARRPHRPRRGVPDLHRLRGLRGARAVRRGRRARARRSARRSATRRKVFLGIDRLDYTKGIYARLRAFAELIRDGELDVEDAVFVQVATPSREQVEEYRVLRDEIDRLVGRINGDLGRIGRPAISYLHSSYPREEMAALYRAADVMVVTPYRDGMNLVAKEYVACRYDDDGALVLSEFAGAAAELRQAWQVNPYDINGMKAALLEAYRPTPRTGSAGCGRCAAPSSSTTWPPGRGASSTSSTTCARRTASGSSRLRRLPESPTRNPGHPALRPSVARERHGAGAGRGIDPAPARSRATPGVAWSARRTPARLG